MPARHRHLLRALRTRLAAERGQATVNWLAIMAGLTVLAAALALALPALAPRIVCSFQNVLAKATGGAIPECNYTAAVDGDVPDASTCLVSERNGEAGAAVTVFSVRGGAKVKLITRRTADGKVYVTVEGGGEIGLEVGTPAGAEVSVDTGSSSTTEGANAKAGVKLTGNGSVTWAFNSEAEAHEFASIVANKARDAALDTNPITGIGRHILGIGEDRDIPAPSIYGLEGGVAIYGEAKGGAGPLSGKAEGELGTSIGGRYDTRTKQTTLYYKVNASGKAGAELFKFAGGRGLAEGEMQMAVTVDKDGTPIQATVIRSGTVIGQLTGKLKGLSGKQSIYGKRTDVRADLDLTDPANRDAFNAFINDPLGGGADDLVTAFNDRSRIGTRVYKASQTDVGVDGKGSIFDVEFGVEAGGKYKTADLSSASYYDRETGTYVPWVECK